MKIILNIDELPEIYRNKLNEINNISIDFMYNKLFAIHKNNEIELFDFNKYLILDNRYYNFKISKSIDKITILIY